MILTQYLRRQGRLVAMTAALTLFTLVMLGRAPDARAYTANKIWFEFRPDGIYRVHVNYTVPELKEFRDATVEFTKKPDAERLYWDLVRGADFFPPDPKARRFVSQPLQPEPW